MNWKNAIVASCALGAAVMGVSRASEAAVVEAGEYLIPLYTLDFQNGVNPFSVTTLGGGSTDLLTDFGKVDNYAVSFSDVSVAGESGNTVSTFGLTSSNAPTLISAINAALDKPAGTVTDFILEYKVERLMASTSPILTQSGLYIEPVQNAGLTPTTGLDRFPAGQPAWAKLTSGTVPLDDYDMDGVLETIDNSEFPMNNNFQNFTGTRRGLRFQIVSTGNGVNGTGTDLVTLNLRVAVRVGVNGTEERAAIDDIRIYQVGTFVPEPSMLALPLLGAALSLGRRRR
jgi:hypothetical protein